mgnify:CR=1 FL=1
MQGRWSRHGPLRRQDGVPSRRRPPLRRRHRQWVMLPLGLVISMSTVFVKQHSILDVFVAIPVCVILYFIIYHRAFVKKFGKAANRDA